MKRELYFFILLIPYLCFGLIEGRLGRIDATSTLSLTYDSNLFNLNQNEYSFIKKSNSRIESKDDFILKFSPVLHYSKDLNLLNFQVSAGAEIARFAFNDSSNYIIPVTNLVLDFDETLSLNKRISNNAKIRFSATFDIGQYVGSDLIEADLVSFTYFKAGFDVRYNHSPKFAVSSGTDYVIRHYQSGSINSNYDDYSNLPISSNIYYIYSPKLDLFFNYTFRKSDSSSSVGTNGDFITHSYSLGANGSISQKLSGRASIGYSNIDFMEPLFDDRNSIISTISLLLNHNIKTKSQFEISKTFSPTARSRAQLESKFRYGLSHNLNQNLNSTIGVFYNNSEVFVSSGITNKVDQTGFDATLTRMIRPNITTSLTYSFSVVSRNLSKFNKHLLSASIYGRF